MSVINRFVAGVGLRFFEAIESASGPNTRIFGVIVGGLATIAMWWLHLRNPTLFFSHQGPLHGLLIVLALIPPFLAAVSLGYLLFPEIARPSLTRSGPMSGYLQSEKAEKKWKLIVTAGALSALNLLCMLFTSSA